MKGTFLLLVALGMAFLVTGFLWPRMDSGRASWTEEKAVAYQEVSAKLHGLSFRDLNKAENKSLFDETKQKYDELDAQLQHARNRGDNVGYWLKVGGGVLAGVGGIGFLLIRDPN